MRVQLRVRPLLSATTEQYVPFQISKGSINGSIAGVLNLHILTYGTCGARYLHGDRKHGGSGGNRCSPETFNL